MATRLTTTVIINTTKGREDENGTARRSDDHRDDDRHDCFFGSGTRVLVVKARKSDAAITPPPSCSSLMGGPVGLNGCLGIVDEDEFIDAPSQRSWCIVVVITIAATAEDEVVLIKGVCALTLSPPHRPRRCRGRKLDADDDGRRGSLPSLPAS